MLGTKLFENYNNYKEKKLYKLWHKHIEITELIKELKTCECFDVECLGKSVEDRDIFCIKAGSGKTNVALWSQMHGNEPTATMAIFDILNFIEAPGEFVKERNKILENLTLYFVPMLNPDGAERFVRENALGIDLNRDAARLQAPESNLLKVLIDTTKAEFGFNLHDQSRAFGAENTGKPATISFLAPAANFEKTVDDKRERSMKVIAGMQNLVNKFSPGCVARYNDDFEPRAFGDNVQKWGTSTILIESGGSVNDFKRQYVRKLNFAIITDALFSIATEAYNHQKLNNYTNIPQNEKNFYDLVIRNANLVFENKKYLVDIGINYHDQQLHDVMKPYRESSIEAIGDLSTMFGYEELDAQGLFISSGKIHKEVYPDSYLLKRNEMQFLQDGFVTVKTSSFPGKAEADSFLIDLISEDFQQKNEFKIGQKANFLLKKDNIAFFAISNGRLIKLRK